MLTCPWLKLRLIGAAFVAIGATSIAALRTPWRDLVLEYNVATLTSALDHDGVTAGTATPLIVVVGGIVSIICGCWVAVGIPWVIDRWAAQQRRGMYGS